MELLKSGSTDPEQSIHLLCVYLVFSRGILPWTSDRTFNVKDASNAVFLQKSAMHSDCRSCRVEELLSFSVMVLKMQKGFLADVFQNVT